MELPEDVSRYSDALLRELLYNGLNSSTANESPDGYDAYCALIEGEYIYEGFEESTKPLGRGRTIIGWTDKGTELVRLVQDRLKAARG